MALLDPIRRMWQGRLDRAVAMAEQVAQDPLSGPAAFSDAQHGLTTPPGSAGATVVGVGSAANQGHLAMQVPVAPEKVAVVETTNADGSVSIYGVPGTLITSGFLIPWEPNPLLAGRLGIDMYQKMRSSDTQVDKTLEMCYQPVLSAKWDVVVDEQSTVDSRQSTVSSTGAGKNTKSKAQEIADAAKQNLLHELGWWAESGLWQAQSWNEILRNCLLMLAFGVSAHERVFRVDGDMLKFARFADLPPRTYYRFDVQPDGRTLRALIQLGFRREYFGQVEVPAERITMFVHRQEGADFWGRSMLRPAYPHWQLKNMLYKVRSLAAERTGLGVVCITLPPNPSKEDRDKAYEFAREFGAFKKTNIVLPSGATFKIHGVEGITYDSMPDVIHHNEQISYVALDFFSNLGRGSGGASGNRALGVSQGKFFNLALQNVASFIAQRFTQQDLRYWTIFNYGLGAPVPILRVSNVQARSFEEVMKILTDGAAAGLVRSDKGIRAEVRNETAMPLETIEDVITARGVTDSVGPETGTVGAGSEQPENQGTGNREQGTGRTSQNVKGKGQNAALSDNDPITRSPDDPILMARAGMTPLVAPRAHPSPFFREGDPEHLRHVYPHEAHVDFPSHWKGLRGAEAKIAAALRAERPRAIRAVAAQMAAGLIAGKRPRDVVIESSGHRVMGSLQSILEPLHQFGRKAVRDEHERLWGAQGRGPTQLSDAARACPERSEGMAALPQAKKSGGLFAEIAAQFFDQAIEDDAVNGGIEAVAKYGPDITDRDEGELTDDLRDAIDDNSDAFCDTIADSAARGTFRAGRSDAFDEIRQELARQGYDLRLIRVCAMEKASCDSCRDANGQELAPGEDITTIHEGPSETCECEAMESI